jgi:hypothetical protein
MDVKLLGQLRANPAVVKQEDVLIALEKLHLT